MNAATQQVIEFLGSPGLNFGSEEDLLLLADPTALQNRVAALLDEPHNYLEGESASTLKTQLALADWPSIAQEFQTRMEMAARFFDADARAAKAPSA